MKIKNYSCTIFSVGVTFVYNQNARKKNEYNESHIVTGKKAPKNENGDFMVPYDAELECKQNVIVYDSNTNTLAESADNPALDCGRLLWEMGSRNRVKILKGGYEEFSALYPFLRTQKIMFMPKEMDELKTYPIEIMPGFLFLGNWRQGNAAYIQKDLKIKGHVNCCVEQGSLIHLYYVRSWNTHKDNKQAVLVFSNLGISRSATVVTAYLMHCFKWTLKEAYNLVLKSCPTIRPNRAFIRQLSKWEADVLGASTTNIEDPFY
ncbi:hypothetical protein KUTeg_009863 [Tegillarca granosa]|uniref:Tyrosine-protein phosphatase domain-containing protein n=1 Tax=Tegillarca granosa TaxID=220873 RepID=A0ABQ9F874_TEGGR|nr:hypothetical protein KUTeg_009863 [Tegillarca granosa]